MKKKAVTFLLSLSLIFSLCAPVFAAIYTDLYGHWARQYIESLASKGYLSGYDDATMRPDNSITVVETFALLSRFYSLNELQQKLIQSDNNDFINQYVPSSLSWANEEVAVCLAAGIVTQSEFKSLELNKPIEKEKLAVFLVRAMKMEKNAASLSTNKLTFEDANTISDSCKTHVALLFSLGIVTGDDRNCFNPKQSVTRAVVAAMVFRSIAYMDKNSVTLSIDAYAGIAQQEGIIGSISGRVLTFYGYNGLPREVNIPADASITVNDVQKSLSTDYVGSKVVVTSNNGTVTKVNIISEASAIWIQGRISGTSLTTESSYIYLIGRDENENIYPIYSSVTVSQNGEEIPLNLITRGYVATMRIENGVVTKIISMSGDTSVKGTITQINLGAIVTIKVSDSSSTNYSFAFSITSMPSITRGSRAITVDRLRTGDEVTLTVSGVTVTGISIADKGTTVSGELTVITKTASGTSWTLKKSDGSTVTYNLGDGVVAYSNSTELNVSDIMIGDAVTVTIFGNVIDEVRRDSSTVSAANQLNGSMILVNTSDYTSTLLTPNGKLVYINTSSLMWIIYADTGSRISLSSLPTGSHVVIYGSYSTPTLFVARVMIVLS